MAMPQTPSARPRRTRTPPLSAPPAHPDWDALDPMARGCLASLWRVAQARRDRCLPDDAARWWRWMGLAGWGVPPSQPLPDPGQPLAWESPPSAARARDPAAWLAWLGAAWATGTPPTVPDPNALITAWDRIWWPQLAPFLTRTPTGWRFLEPDLPAAPGANPPTRRPRTHPLAVTPEGLPPVGYDPARADKLWAVAAPAETAFDPWQQGACLLNPDHPERARPAIGALIRDHGPAAVLASLTRLAARASRPAAPLAWIKGDLRQQARAQAGASARGGLVI